MPVRQNKYQGTPPPRPLVLSTNNAILHRFIINRHAIYFIQEGENTPLDILKKQEGEKQALEIQALEKQALENPIQINTNK